MNNNQEPKNLIELAKFLKEKNIPDSQSRLYFDQFLEKKARNQGIPLTGNFELTPMCNLDCKMCYVHLDNKQYTKDELLPTSTWKKLIYQAYKVGMRNASITGGECLTYPGFDEIYLYFHELGIIPGVLSNGILIDQKLDLFKNHPPRMIQISLYGSSNDAYEKVTGHRVFDIVYRNLQLLRDNGLPVKITTTPNEYMRGDVISLLEATHRLNIPTYVNANLIPPRENTGREIHDLTIDEYVEIYKAQSRLNQKEPTPVDLAELPDESHEGIKKYGLLCGAGRSSFGIRYDGRMCPCLSLGEITVDTLENGFESAWKEINDIANNYPLPEECGTCVYRSRCLPCIAMHSNAPNPGHCDPRICERTKKLMAAGFIPLIQKQKED